MNKSKEHPIDSCWKDAWVRAAVHLITNRCGGGVLNPADMAHSKDGPLGKTVFDVLPEKHPAQRPPDCLAFLERAELSPLEHVDITNSHIEHVARHLFESAGPSGTDSDHWRAFLLHYGNASACLHEAVAVYINPPSCK